MIDEFGDAQRSIIQYKVVNQTFEKNKNKNTQKQALSVKKLEPKSHFYGFRFFYITVMKLFQVTKFQHHVIPLGTAMRRVRLT